MKKRNTAKPEKSKVQRQRDPIPWRYCVLTLCCGLILVAGFFVAARQHFSSIDLGIKNSQLRKQVDELEADKRRFILAKEIAMSPDAVKKAAKKLGFQETSFNNVEIVRPLNNLAEKAKSVYEKTKQLIADKPDEKSKNDKQPDKKSEDKNPAEKKKTKVQIAKK